MKLFTVTLVAALFGLSAACDGSSNNSTDVTKPPKTHRPPKTRTPKPSATTLTPGTSLPPSTTSPPASTPPSTTAPGAGTPVDGWWKPTPGTTYQIQLSGNLKTDYNVQMFDLDLFDTSADTIAKLKSKGVKVVCYFSAGTYEDWREDKSKFTKDMYGKNLPEWKGEYWVDTRNEKVREIVKTRMQLAKDKGCDGVDPDNVDGAFNDNGLGLTAATQLDFNRFLAETGHSLGLAVGLKNDLQQVDELSKVFDFAVNEQCAEYDECETLQPFIKLNKPVFGIEYNGNKKSVCAAANKLNMDTLFKSLDLLTERYSCRDQA
ncbi:hypothetical protein Poli38472_005053 [Pythium oligandrum]|uniref:Glycoside-hydrolase family GH114 TIM-barrel domain-containing protein n=1 Tax=Pythium oligandrum TaxID=41045 RepID=A0A8K1CGT0_PYTOL|nr:hypothetical protein Poli38472_005053 [Pythium oligandrum]|eukprot:TMW62435.1 hypothetical protein Poli38472_005053 [Pythium oligandrum]